MGSHCKETKNMNKRIQSAWNKLTQARANIWLTAVIVVLFVTAVTVLNMLNLEYSDTQARSLAGTATQTSLGIGQPILKLTAVPPQVAYSTDANPKQVYLKAEFSNAANCYIQGPIVKEDGTIETTNIDVPYTSTIPIEITNTPKSGVSSFAYTLNCGRIPNNGSVSLELVQASATVTFFDPHNAPTAELTAQELDINKNITLENPTPFESTITITEGNGVKLIRTCTNAQSGYITNERGTILTPTASRTKTTETLNIKHDTQGTTTPPNGIHSNHTYTAHCFSGVNQNRKDTTDTIDVIVR